MTIYEPEVVLDDNVHTYRAKFESGGIEREIFFSTPKEYAEFADTESSNAFVLALLYYAMRGGEDITVRGKISQKLKFNLNHYAVPLLNCYDNRLKRISIKCENTTDESTRSLRYIGTGFSGGIDSFCTIYDNFIDGDVGEYKIDKLFFFNVGAYGLANNRDELDNIRSRFVEKYNLLKPYSEEIGLEFIPVDSNVHEFIPWGYLETCTLAISSAAMFMGKGLSKYYIASSGHNYKEIASGLSAMDCLRSISMIDTQLLPLISTENMQLIADGTKMDRAEKTEHIMNYEGAKKYLNVCVKESDGGKNCSECPKCCRTMLTLEVMGRIFDFEKVFDFDKYKARRIYTIATVLANKNSDPFSCQIAKLADKYGYPLGKQVGLLDMLKAQSFRKFERISKRLFNLKNRFKNRKKFRSK